MPHLHIEYSSNLEKRVNIDALCQELHQSMLDTGVFPRVGIRVRAYAANAVAIADGHENNSFAHLTLRMGAGRTLEQKKTAGDAIFKVAQAFLSAPLKEMHHALSMEIVEIDADLSWKDNGLRRRMTYDV